MIFVNLIADCRIPDPGDVIRTAIGSKILKDQRKSMRALALRSAGFSSTVSIDIREYVRESGIRNQKSEIRKWKSEIRNPKSGRRALVRVAVVGGRRPAGFSSTVGGPQLKFR